MKPVDFPQSNATLTPPANMTAEECESLHVHRDPRGFLISCWELSGEEMMEILQSKRVWLWVWSGQSQPAVSVGTDDPFCAGGSETSSGDGIVPEGR